MTEAENLLIAYRIGHRFDMKLAAAALARDWMDQASRGFANCCHLDAVMWLHRTLTLPPERALCLRGWKFKNNLSRSAFQVLFAVPAAPVKKATNSGGNCDETLRCFNSYGRDHCGACSERAAAFRAMAASWLGLELLALGRGMELSLLRIWRLPLLRIWISGRPQPRLSQ